MKRKLFAEED